jgi:hypothetical protein
MTGKVGKLSNYPNGFNGGLLLNGEPLTRTHTGKIFYVADGDTAGNTAAYPNRKTPSNGNKGTFLDPFATIDYAIEQCTAERGDIIYVLPGYTQVVETEGQIDVDVDGVAIIGLGTGVENMPILSYDAAAGEVEVNADNVTIAGLNLQCAAEEVLIAVDVTAEANGFKFVGNKFTESGAAGAHFVQHLELTANDDAVIAQNRWELLDTEVESTDAIEITTASDNVVIKDNYFLGAFSTAAISDAAAGTNYVIENNTFILDSEGTLDAEPAIELEATSNGVYRDNTFVGSAAVGAMVAAAGMYDIGGNVYSATAASAPTTLNGGSNEMKLFVATEIEVDTADAICSVESGTVAIWGILGEYQAVGGGTDKFDIVTEATGNPASYTLMTGVDESLIAAGDQVYAATNPGGNQTSVEVGANGTFALWNSPLYVTGDTEIDVANAEAAVAAGDANFYIFYTPVTAGAAVAAAEA